MIVPLLAKGFSLQPGCQSVFLGTTICTPGKRSSKRREAWARRGYAGIVHSPDIGSGQKLVQLSLSARRNPDNKHDCVSGCQLILSMVVKGEARRAHGTAIGGDPRGIAEALFRNLHSDFSIIYRGYFRMHPMNPPRLNSLRPRLPPRCHHCPHVPHQDFAGGSLAHR